MHWSFKHSSHFDHFKHFDHLLNEISTLKRGQKMVKIFLTTFDHHEKGYFFHERRPFHSAQSALWSLGAE